jgi:hypothetical protein
MSKLTERGTEDHHAIGEHVAPNHGPAGGNTGQRTVVRVPGSITPLSYKEAVTNGTKTDKDEY